MDIFDQKGIHPMLISEQVEPYDDKNSIFELKLDGCRCIAYCDGTVLTYGTRETENFCLSFRSWRIYMRIVVVRVFRWGSDYPCWW